MRLVLALVGFLAATQVEAAADVVVYYLDKTYAPVTRLDRLAPTSEGLKAILAMYALQVGGGCDLRDENGNMQCIFSSALGLGAQCSMPHVGLVRQWFKTQIPKMSGFGDWNYKQPQKPGQLETICYNSPEGATFQTVWEIIRVAREGALVHVSAIAAWMARDHSGRVRYESQYKVNKDSIDVVSHKEVRLLQAKEESE